MDKLEPLKPILTAHLYSKLERKLIELLRSLSPDEWAMQTIAPQWKVKDVAAHLLDTQLRKLSMARDGYFHERARIESPADLVALVNRLNQDGVALYRRLSPGVLISLMEVASREVSEYQESLDPFALGAAFAVSWAGETESYNWFDMAREFTERWHHQQQIRLAVNRPGIMTREFYYPVIDAFMRALPFHYRDIEHPPGAMAQFNISGECGGTWYLYLDDAGWRLVASPIGDKIAEITIPQEIAWRIFTKGIDQQAAKPQMVIEGDGDVGFHILKMVAIVG